MKNALVISAVIFGCWACGVSASTSVVGTELALTSIGNVVQLPETKGRKGSKRTGGRNSKGKGGRYVGGRK